MPSVSKKQQRFFGMIYGADKAGKKLKGKAGKAQKSMTKKQVKDFTTLKEDVDIDFEKLFYLIEHKILKRNLKKRIIKVSGFWFFLYGLGYINNFKNTYNNFKDINDFISWYINEINTNNNLKPVKELKLDEVIQTEQDYPLIKDYVHNVVSRDDISNYIVINNEYYARFCKDLTRNRMSKNEFKNAAERCDKIYDNQGYTIEKMISKIQNVVDNNLNK